MPKNLLHFFDAPEEKGGTSENETQQTTNQSSGQSSHVIDYDKIASIVQGKQNVAEDTVLRNYFKQQGLSGEEMAQAISQFKEQKAANTPDVNSLKQQMIQKEAQLLQATLEKEVQLAAIRQGVSINHLPYVLKLADLSGLTLESQTEDYEAVISKVLEDVPALKTTVENNMGFQQVGSTGQIQKTATSDLISAAFGNK